MFFQTSFGWVFLFTVGLIALPLPWQFFPLMKFVGYF
jgi:hypothetical protein